MAVTTDPRTGFVTRNSQTDEEWKAERAAAREAATSGAFTGPGTVGQGVRGEPTPSGFTLAQLSDHGFYQAHKADILAAHARGELPGQDNYTTNLLGL